MVFDTSLINKRIQYITVDSEFISGSNNVFSVNFGTSTTSVATANSITSSVSHSSNIFVQEMRNVIGLKLVDFYVTQVGTFEAGPTPSYSIGSPVFSGGSGYSVGDTITFSAPQAFGGIPATATVTGITPSPTTGPITTVLLTSPGSGYTSAPTTYTTTTGSGIPGTVTVSLVNPSTTSASSLLAVKYIDILCPDLPDTAQILDERKSKIFARVPLERDFSGASNIIANDKQWKSFNRQTNYFNPISITKLNFQMFELTGSSSIAPGNFGTYQPLQPDAQFYMILEVTTIDYEAITLPKEDNTIKVVNAIEQLEKRFVSLFEELPDMIKAGIPEPVAPGPVAPIPIAVQSSSSIAHSPVPQPPSEEVVAQIVPPPKKIDTKMYIIIALIILFIAYLFSKK